MRILIASVLACALGACAQERDPPLTFEPRIERDEYGVPTALGATDAEAAFSLAYAHAEDDFPTIQLVVLAARGRLGARLGEQGAASDFFYHVLRVEDAVRDGYETQLSAETRALIEGYAAGLNAYADAHPHEVLPGAENVRGRDVAAGFALTSPLFWGFDAVLSQLVDENSHPCAQQTAQAPLIDRGSNAFAVAPSRSDDGHTRLIVNSHQPWSGPVAWWEARVRSDAGWTMQGGVFPGSPVPLLGTNGSIGYAATVNTPDLADLYRLTTDDAHPGRYLFDGAWRPFERRLIWLGVRVGPIVLPVPRTLSFSVHGPAFRTADGWIAVRYAGAGDLRGVEQYYRMSRARTFEEWRAALEMRAIPSTNLVYADRTGRIAYFYNSASPRRAAGENWRGCVAGDTSRLLQEGLVPIEEIPHLIDPASGWLYNSNATPFSATDEAHDLDPDDFAPELGIETRRTNRSLRAMELLSPLARISDAQLIDAKFDVTYSADSRVAELISRVVALDARGDQRFAQAQELLRTWDRAATRESRAAALALLTYLPFYEAGRLGQEMPDAREAFTNAIAQLTDAAGRIDPPLGEMLRLRRGRHDLALQGGPDLLHAIGWETAQDGRMAANFGDGLMIVVDWDREGRATVRSIHQFGAATGRPNSPHYDDQSPLYARREWRVNRPN
ncbi:MAG: penicillin acylase family protein [Hyphomonadaceae bacterium]